MSVVFDIRGHVWPPDAEGYCLPPASMYLQISNSNARDFLQWLALDDSNLYGEIPTRELAALLHRRLWPSNRHRGDHGQPQRTHRIAGRATLIECGREPGCLAEYAERLLALAEHAGDGTIVWS